eukprot:c26724_g2_i1 orf=190-4170(-)
MASHSRLEGGGATTSADAQINAKFHMADSMGEWRSLEQLEASSPSTSPPSWESDDDLDFGSSVLGARPSELYGKFTWKIENFSRTSKRELRSSVFEVGGYKWYILVYPQGCDVCNHLSLFLCVADYDKLLPGWSYFAQFTIAVVNKDPTKSKYSDTLHRFCKKEHDWGWKKFMELAKVVDGFTVADTLVIKAQVQVIRENPHRPFRCLDCQYRRELLRVYLTNVEGICRRFLEEKRDKIGKLMEDTIRWSSFCAFWSAVEENIRHRLARERTDVILKAVVKRFFNEKEVTSTLVMDALYSGCKALDYCSKKKKGRINGVEMGETLNLVVCIEKDAFVLAGDVLSLLERAATEPLPPYKDDKGPQNRTKDGSQGDDFAKDFVERDERRLIELGRRTVEMFVLAYLFSNHVEVAYREAIALRRQEELIREEEAAGQAEIELKAKREAAEKEKRTKKKQAKQRRNNRKDKDKEVEEKNATTGQVPRNRKDTSSGRIVKASPLKEQQRLSAPREEHGDDEDDLSGMEMTDDTVGTLGHATEDGDVDSTVWEREGPELHHVMVAGYSGVVCEDSVKCAHPTGRHQLAVLDDSSSTCSSDSLPSINAAANSSFGVKGTLTDVSHTVPSRERGMVGSLRRDKDAQLLEADGILCASLDTSGLAETSSSCTVGMDSELDIRSFKEHIQWLEQRLAEKEEEVVVLKEQLRSYQPQIGTGRPNYERNQPGETADCINRSGIQDVRLSSLSNSCGGKSVLSTSISKDDQNRQDSGTACGRGCSSAMNEPTRWLDHGHSVKLASISSNGPEIADPEEESFVSRSLLPSTSLKISPEYSAPGSISYLDVSSAGMATVLELVRPSSAPVLPAVPQLGFPVAQLHSAPPLARSASAAGRLGLACVETMASSSTITPQSPPGTPSYRNATAGKMQTMSASAYGGVVVPTIGAAVTNDASNPGCCPYNNATCLPCPSLSIPSSDSGYLVSAFAQKIPVIVADNVKIEAAEESICAIKIVDGTEGRVLQGDGLREDLTCRFRKAETSMGFTFGTITPEMLHLQHQQNQQHERDGDVQHLNKYHLLHAHPLHEQLLKQSDKGRHSQGFESHHLQLAHSHQLIQQSHKYNYNNLCGSTENGSNTGALQQTRITVVENANNGTVLSEEFPHLDIINDLLDEDKNLGRVLSAFLQPAGSQTFHHLSFQDRHQVNSICTDPEAGKVYGYSQTSERGVACSDNHPQAHTSVDHVRNKLTENAQSRSTFIHPTLPHSFCQQSGTTDGISSYHCLGGNIGLPMTRNFNAAQSMVDLHPGFPLQNHQLHIADCPTLALLQNGYSLYTPPPPPP